MANRGVCGHCNRIVALRDNDTMLRAHRVAEGVPVMCNGKAPYGGKVFDVAFGEIEVVSRADQRASQEQMRYLRDQLQAAQSSRSLDASTIADLEEENRVLRSTHSSVDRDLFGVAVDVVLNSGKLNMRQLQVFWEVARGQAPADLLEKLMGR